MLLSSSATIAVMHWLHMDSLCPAPAQTQENLLGWIEHLWSITSGWNGKLFTLYRVIIMLNILAKWQWEVWKATTVTTLYGLLFQCLKFMIWATPEEQLKDTESLEKQILKLQKWQTCLHVSFWTQPKANAHANSNNKLMFWFLTETQSHFVGKSIFLPTSAQPRTRQSGQKSNAVYGRETWQLQNY